MFANLWQDVRYASRRLVAQPGFTLVAVLTLALGIGATTAIFSVVNGVLLKPLPFDEPERLVGLYHRGGAVNLAVMNQGPATYFTYRDNQRVFEDIGGWEANQVSITGRGEPERAEVLSVTHTTLPLLRVQPALGRLFSKEDDAPGGASSAAPRMSSVHRSTSMVRSARSSACCPPLSGSCASIRTCCSRCSSNA